MSVETIEPQTTLVKMGRGQVNIDWDFVDKKLEAHCSAESIANRLGINRTTLYRRCEVDRGMTFSTLTQLKRQDGDDDLRNKQHEVAMSGDKVMLVWLGKNRLGQSDKQEIDHSSRQLTEKVLESFTEWLEFNPEATQDERSRAIKDFAALGKVDEALLRQKAGVIESSEAVN